MNLVARSSIPVVFFQFAENALTLANSRLHLVCAAHVKLNQLGRLDERLVAVLDGLVIIEKTPPVATLTMLHELNDGEIFVAVVRLIDSGGQVVLNEFLTTKVSLICSRMGLIAAFGWVSAASLKGITKALLDSPNPSCRQIGLATCAIHQVNPGVDVVAALNDENAGLRARALCVVADLGLVEYLPTCTDALTDEDPDCAYQAARAGALLGDRGASVSALHRIALAPRPWRSRALGLLLKLQSPADAHITLKALAQHPACIRLLIQGIGTAGDPHYVPWLIQQMQDLKLSRLAGESFSFITGLDLAYLDLERKPPEGVDFGPNDDPNDDNVAMDEDDGLPWPDVEKVSRWWQAHGHRFTPSKRYFMGEPPSSAHCLDVLKNGYQRQRIAAAIYLCLLKPGTPLFNCAAPAWRQQRLLAKMVA